ncbi:hypothetical protein ES703_72789 [subsurface metagenome]
MVLAASLSRALWSIRAKMERFFSRASAIFPSFAPFSSSASRIFTAFESNNITATKKQRSNEEPHQLAPLGGICVNLRNLRLISSCLRRTPGPNQTTSLPDNKHYNPKSPAVSIIWKSGKGTREELQRIPACAGTSCVDLLPRRREGTKKLDADFAD